ncbi:MAG: carboxypeptidase-like regulatory domain-containing protein [Ferruginibacter sp.]
MTDGKDDPVQSVNIFIEGTFDGSSSDSAGNFIFRTLQTGVVRITFESIGFKKHIKTLELKPGDTVLVNAVLDIDIYVMEPVSIIAGTFEASDKKRSTILKPFDIETTAGGAADIYQVLQMLPGNQHVGESEGLFVRGGDASESKTFIDGMLVKNPFYGKIPDIPQRGRFQPYLFNGIVFNSGGYSAEYGKALSSALILNIKEELDTSSSSFGLNLVSTNLYAGKTWGKAFLGTGVSYSNLKPFFKLDKQITDWIKPVETIEGELNYKFRPSKGVLKIHSNFSSSVLSLKYQDFAGNDLIDKLYSNKNKNIFFLTSYRIPLGNGFSLSSGFSHAANANETFVNQYNLSYTEKLFQLRAVLSKQRGSNGFRIGGDVSLSRNTYADSYFLTSKLASNEYSSFIESDIYLSKLFALRTGLRAEYSSVIRRGNLAPRISLAYKVSLYSQVSFAYGIFNQIPGDTILLLTKNLDFSRSNHYIVNYQRIKENRTLRLELYEKRYSNLVGINSDNQFTAAVTGYARGFDLFWRDKKSLKNTDYWISYSLIDTKRKNHQNNIVTIPSYISTHTISVIYKYQVPKLNTTFGITYKFASGRFYKNPRGFEEITPAYHNVSLSAGKLIGLFRKFSVFYISADNIFNRYNVYGYKYSADGNQRLLIGPPNLRSVFVGFYITF